MLRHHPLDKKIYAVLKALSRLPVEHIGEADLSKLSGADGRKNPASYGLVYFFIFYVGLVISVSLYKDRI
jgi:hypothetical protein